MTTPSGSASGGGDSGLGGLLGGLFGGKGGFGKILQDLLSGVQPGGDDVKIPTPGDQTGQVRAQGGQTGTGQSGPSQSSAGQPGTGQPGMPQSPRPGAPGPGTPQGQQGQPGQPGQPMPMPGGMPQRPQQPSGTPQGGPQGMPQGGPQGGMPQGGPQGGTGQQGQTAAGAAAGGAAGAFGSLLDRLRGAGLGDQVDSWLGSGPNKTLDPQQVTQALGPDRIKTMADHAGVSQDEVAHGLAKALPEVVNDVTPNGRMPSPDQLQSWMRKLTG